MCNVFGSAKCNAIRLLLLLDNDISVWSPGPFKGYRVIRYCSVFIAEISPLPDLYLIIMLLLSLRSKTRRLPLDLHAVISNTFAR